MRNTPRSGAQWKGATLTLHGWNHVIKHGETYMFDAQQGDFVAASLAFHCGTRPYQHYVEHDGQIISD